MAEERRNLYRILHVQPEAPQEVIRASWRTMMSTLRTHPDLGGDASVAARINAAYEVLADPERRRAYDEALGRARSAGPAARPAPVAPAGGERAAAARHADPAAWQADRVCPFCRLPLPASVHAESRCDGCGSPIFKLPAMERGELFGRRRSPRNSRPMTATLRWPGSSEDQVGRLRDLSLNGLSVLSPVSIPERTPLRVMTSGFDGVAVVVDRRRHADGWVLHSELLTLQLHRTQGVFVSARA